MAAPQQAVLATVNSDAESELSDVLYLPGVAGARQEVQQTLSSPAANGAIAPALPRSCLAVAVPMSPGKCPGKGCPRRDTLQSTRLSAGA
jgi:hypothetical protein